MIEKKRKKRKQLSHLLLSWIGVRNRDGRKSVECLPSGSVPLPPAMVALC